MIFNQFSHFILIKTRYPIPDEPKTVNSPARRFTRNFQRNVMGQGILGTISQSGRLPCLTKADGRWPTSILVKNRSSIYGAAGPWPICPAIMSMGLTAGISGGLTKGSSSTIAAKRSGLRKVNAPACPVRSPLKWVN